MVNPGSLGLIAFGMTTLLVSLHNLGLFAIDSVILSMAICIGGFAQVVAGLLEFKSKNVIGANAFTFFGLFWIAFAIIGTDVLSSPAEPMALASFYAIWGLYTLIFVVALLKKSILSRIIFTSVMILFFVLAAIQLSDLEFLPYLAGALGLIAGGAAMYDGAGIIINEVHEKEVLPR